jgi:hypothetical protein
MVARPADAAQARGQQGNRSAHVEEAEAGELRFLQEIALQVLFFEHGELVGGHFAAVGAELAI